MEGPLITINQKQELSVAPCLLMDWDEMSNPYRGPAIDAFYQVPVHLAKRCKRRRFSRNQPIRNKNCLWQFRPSPLTNTVQQAILVSDWLISRTSSLKSIGQMNRSLIGSKSLWRTCYRCFLPSSGSFGQAV
jgi:hypothetical protein